MLVLLFQILFIHHLHGFRLTRQPKFLRADSSIHLAGYRDDGNSNLNSPYTAVLIVPTGIGASIGGYAGDALPSAKLLSSVVDTLITHPNVMNGAMLYWPVPNILYVEGHALDAFAAGSLSLRPSLKRGNRVGLLLDRALALEPHLLQRHLRVAEAMRATLGIDIAQVVITPRPVGVVVSTSQESGASWGSLGDSMALVEGAEELVKQHHCTAIAVVVRFPEIDQMDQSGNVTAKELFDSYRLGQGVDAIAGVEALISHIISIRLGVPVAHAPAFEVDIDLPDNTNEFVVSPKACAEELGFTFLPCVLAYLHRAPQLVSSEPDKIYQDNSPLVRTEHVDAVVVPYNALGGPAVLSFLSRNVLVIAVLDNETSMNVEATDLIKNIKSKNVLFARSYAEAAGYLAAHKAGILFESITSKVSFIPIKQL